MSPELKVVFEEIEAAVAEHEKASGLLNECGHEDSPEQEAEDYVIMTLKGLKRKITKRFPEVTP